MDTGAFHYRSWIETLPGYGIPFSPQDFVKIFGRKNEDFIPLLAGRDLSQALVAEIGERKEEAFRALVRAGVALLPGVAEWLERFSRWGLAQAVASSAPKENVDTLLEVAGIRTSFQVIVSADGLPGKPDPAIFLKAAAMLGIQPEDCLVLEDATAGVEAAGRARMGCIAVATTNPAEALQAADLVVERLSDLTPETFLEIATV
jgi:HAD superfamily hydrolase (TIGR01509 family)